MADDIVVTRTVDAPPERVWDLVGDPARIGAISPECHRVDWLGGASGPAPGARFKGHNRKGLMRWSTVGEVVEYEPQRTISWDVTLLGQPVARWGFRLAPQDGGTRVEQFWQDQRSPVANVVGRARAWDAPTANRRGMEQTLDTVRRKAEQG
ncbi:SRPBCC family protein [Actinomycetospora straminea]|uniref:SRPBCC family protein n=1 Tax=Actinomycetospora straminea TaxID=663607 RepID=A0ABP9DY81_9PSEU|nr:SRPBCC family protein [Actinomycetospora straminea]MDD7934143.1 SRPBCC family protein [Actinomycetospora straminea]